MKTNSYFVWLFDCVFIEIHYCMILEMFVLSIGIGKTNSSCLFTSLYIGGMYKVIGGLTDRQIEIPRTITLTHENKYSKFGIGPLCSIDPFTMTTEQQNHTLNVHKRFRNAPQLTIYGKGLYT